MDTTTHEHTRGTAEPARHPAAATRAPAVGAADAAPTLQLVDVVDGVACPVDPQSEVECEACQ